MMKKSISTLIGLGGVSENDSERARSWSVRFDRLIILLAVLMMPFLVEIGRAHVRTPVTEKSRMPSSA